MRILSPLFVIIGFSRAFGFSNEPLLGTWHLQKTLCYSAVTRKVFETQLFRLPLVGSLPSAYSFDPKVELQITEAQDGRVHVQKKVPERSCPGKTGDRALLVSTYQASVLAMRWNGNPYFQVTSAEAPQLANIRYQINSELLDECGPKPLAWALKALVAYQFPKYFLHEAGRGYQMYLDVQSQQLFVRFAEPDICDGMTAMVFKK